MHLSVLGFLPVRCVLNWATETQILQELLCLKRWAVVVLIIDIIKCLVLIPQAVVLALVLELGMERGAYWAFGVE